MPGQILKILKHPLTTSSIVGVIAFSSGVAIGYFMGRKREVIVVKPSEKKEEMPEEVSVDPNQLTFESVNEYDEAATEQGGVSVIVPIVIEEPQVVHSFVKFNDSDDWDYEVEEKLRNEAGPYILHYDEFMNDERGYSQTTLTYFGGDNILVDEEDVPIYNHENVVGELKFGHGSNDPNVVYIRNPRMKAEWEILFSNGTYAQEVLGLEIERDITSKGSKNEIPKFRKE